MRNGRAHGVLFGVMGRKEVWAERTMVSSFGRDVSSGEAVSKGVSAEPPVSVADSCGGGNQSLEGVKA